MSSEFPPMRSWDDVQQAHDVLLSLFFDQRLFDLVVDADDQDALRIVADTLCWVLGHNHNKNFEERYREIRERLEAVGVLVLSTDDGKPS